METRQNPTKNRRKTTVPVKTAASARPAGKTATQTRRAATQNTPKTTPRRRTPRKRSNVPEVVYTPAAIFSRGQLLVRLLTVVAVVLALIFGISIFFHVETVTVSGAEKYDEWTVREASGIRDGDNLLSVNDAQVSGNIITKLPYVKSVRVGIKLPNTVNIYIEEQDIVYAIRDTGNLWWLITGDGVVVEQTDIATAGEYPQILGINLYKAAVGEPAVAQEPESEEPVETNEAGETIPQPVTILGAQKLSTALSIVQYLEDCRVIDQIVSVDVSDMGNILVRYGQQYDINLGDTTEMKYKIELATRGIPALDKQYNKPTGTIDVSFRIDRNLMFSFAANPAQ